jgi:hypothetical protein
MSISDRLREIESEYSLFRYNINGVKIWEKIRYIVYRKIEKELSSNQEKSKSNQSLTKKVGGLFKSTFTQNPFLVGDTEYLIYGHGRRKKEEGGYFWDIYVDCITEYCNLNNVYMSHEKALNAEKQTKTKCLKNLDPLFVGCALLRKIGLFSVSLSKKDKRNIKNVTNILEEKFKIKIDLPNLVSKYLSVRRSLLFAYEKILNKVKPRVAMVVVSYTKSKQIFIDACHNNGVPVVELQHGAISDDHIGYNYPQEVNVRSFPDYIFVWGKYWKKSASFPISDDRVMCTGFPYLDEKKKIYNKRKTARNTILFISQWTVGRQLSKLAINTYKNKNIQFDVLYKLHPSEYEKWEEKYPELTKSNINVIGRSGPPLYQLFANSYAQVGVYSTAIYEGLCFGLKTFIFQCPKSKPLQPLVSDGSAKYISSAEDIECHISSKDMNFDSENYFRPNALQKTCDTLERLRAGASIHYS